MTSIREGFQQFPARIAGEQDLLSHSLATNHCEKLFLIIYFVTKNLYYKVKKVMKKPFFTAALLLLGILSITKTSLAAASVQTVESYSAPIEKSIKLNHKTWFFRFQVQQPTVGYPPPGGPRFGHFQVTLRDPSEEVIYKRTFSMQQLSPTIPSVQTIKISKPLKGIYRLHVTLLDRKNDAGIFDSQAVDLASTYFFNAELFDNEKMKTNLPSIAPFLEEIALPTDPAVFGTTFFSLNLP